MKILCIEDGSVDIEALTNAPDLCDGKILIYRQGSVPPYIIEL